MIDSTREPDLVRLLADLEGRLYAQERLSGAAGGSSTVTGPVHITVKNTSGGALSAGTAVYATGSVGASGAVEVGVCDNTNTATMPALGLLDADLANNGEGSATILGIIDQIDTSGWSINDELWVNGAGALTNVRPTSGLIQKIGRVVRVNASTGEVLVLGAGRTNDVPFPLFVDHANQRVGIGTTSPERSLHVYHATIDHPLVIESGDNRAGIEMKDSNTVTSPLIRAYGDNLRFNTNGTDGLVLNSDGKVGIGTTSPVSDMLNIGDSSNNGSMRVHTAQGAEGFRVASNIVRSANIKNLTTGSSANVFINTSNSTMYRSTVSALKYKTDVETMEDQYADAILGLRPVWYRSLCAADPASYGYWGFIAEEVAEVDPRLVNFGVPDDYVYEYDDDGERVDPPVEDLTEPEGVQYDRFVPHLVNLVKRQQDTIEALDQRIEALEAN